MSRMTDEELYKLVYEKTNELGRGTDFTTFTKGDQTCLVFFNMRMVRGIPSAVRKLMITSGAGFTKADVSRFNRKIQLGF